MAKRNTVLDRYFTATECSVESLIDCVEIYDRKLTPEQFKRASAMKAKLEKMLRARG